VLITGGHAESARCRWMLVRLDQLVGLYRLCSETRLGAELSQSQSSVGPQSVLPVSLRVYACLAPRL